MDFHELCELADREFTLGLADERLVQRAYEEAQGAPVLARQNYWRLRAKDLQREIAERGSDERVAALKAEIEFQEKRMCAQKNRHRWFWAIVSYGAGVGALVFPLVAMVQHSRGGQGFAGWVFLSVACFVMTLIGYAASRYHTGGRSDYLK